MKVSIIIPVYNCAGVLEETLCAVRAQTYEEIEIILVENGSTDRSLEICKKCMTLDERVRLVEMQSNVGAAMARNAGVAVASGEYISFVDSDDLPKKNMIEVMLSSAMETDADVIICGYETFVESVGDKNRECFSSEYVRLDDPIAVRGFFAEAFPDGLVGFPWNKLYKRSLLVDNNICFPYMARLEDGIFNIDVFSVASSCIVVPDILYSYRVSTQDATLKKCPRDYYDLISELTTYFIHKKSEWASYPDKKIFAFFLNELGTCIESAYAGNWGMTLFQRRAYFGEICFDKLFITSLDYTDEVGAYRKLLVKLMILKKYNLLGIVIFIKVCVKKVFKKAYYFVRRKVQG